MKPYGIIYKITNKVNLKVYIGQTTKSVETRWKCHCKPNKRNKTYIKSAIQYYGKENFLIETIDTANTKEDLDAKEVYWITYYSSMDSRTGYNLRSGGSFGIHNETVRKRISNSKTGKSPNRDYSLISEETKNKISTTLKSRYKDADFKERICSHLKNPSGETREKMSKSKKGRKLSQETKHKISQALKGKCNRWKNKNSLENEEVTSGK